jgi:hypothetical protein
MIVALVSAAGCRRDGCVGGDDGRCLPPTACTALHYSCGYLPGTLRLRQVGADEPPSKDPKSLLAAGDFELSNDLVRVVLDAPEHPHHLAPSGGSIIDFAPVGPGAEASGDQTNAIYQAAGLLPRDAVHYESAEPYEHLGDPAEAYVAVVFRGHLEADRRVSVVTRYELRACEPGVRVRTDVFNGAAGPNTLYLADAFFWGDNTLAPFVPGPGLGFRAPTLDLERVDEAWREWPFLAARSQGSPDTSYAAVPCDRDRGAGFNSTTLSADGIPLRTTQAGDGDHFERFLIAKPGQGLSSAVGEALRARAMIHGDPPPVTVTGSVVSNGVPIEHKDGRAMASLLIYEPAFGFDPDDESRRIPWTEVVPDSLGRFQASVPPDRSYRIQAYAFGQPTGAATPGRPTTFAVGGSDVEVGDVSISSPARLLVNVESQAGTSATYAQLVVVPSEPASGTVLPTFQGLFPGCEPMLGPPHGGSPACNRALTDNGRFDLLVPPGRYHVYATRGPFASIDRATIELRSGQQVSLTLVSKTLADLVPKGAISGDFHVHGAGSYDSSIPDQDRVFSFLAADVDVIVATDHDVVTTYEDTIKAVSAPLTVIPGVEQTPNILWFAVPDETFPRTLGHFNFWPLSTGARLRSAAPWDELREPGQLMDDVEPLFLPDTIGVRQLNHPYSESKLGRDQGFLRAIKYDPRAPVATDPGFAASVLRRVPGTRHRNMDWDVQEVMTGISRADWLRYRALWFSLLSQGVLRAGTANSDTHSLALEQVGYPRNLVFGEYVKGNTLDIAAFDADVRAGHLVGTNGPVLEVSIVDADNKGDPFHPDLDPAKAIKLTPNMTLNIVVSGAPWIPVEEVRVIVNGSVKQHRMSQLTALANVDHFGTQPWRITIDPISVNQLVQNSEGSDSWLVVEVGMKEEDEVPDRDDDGLPDLEEENAAPKILEEMRAIVPGAWPVAFSNPFLIDVKGDGWTHPGLQ